MSDVLTPEDLLETLARTVRGLSKDRLIAHDEALRAQLQEAKAVMRELLQHADDEGWYCSVKDKARAWLGEEV